MSPGNYIVILSCIFIFSCVECRFVELPSGIIQLDVIVSARNLPDMDPKLLPADHPADPYAVVKYKQAYAYTETLKNNPNPQWTKIFSYQLDLDDGDANHYFQVQVWDDDYGLAAEYIASTYPVYINDLIESPGQSIETQLTESPNESWVTIQVVGINGTRILRE